MSDIEWVGVEDAAGILEISVRTLRRWVRDAYGPKPRRWGGRRTLQWRRDELETFKQSDTPDYRDSGRTK